MDAMTALFGRIGSSCDDFMPAVNEKLSLGDLTVTREEVRRLAEGRAESLVALERVEFGAPAIVGIAEVMATSPYLEQEMLADVLLVLQEAFYELRSDIEVDVPDSEIFEALRRCFDACGGDAAEVASLPADEVMPFSEDYLQALEGECDEAYLIVDDEGRAYAFNPADWSYDEHSDGWDGERWGDDWDD